MDTKNIQPGVYKLTKDIENPNADRRKKRDWRYEPTWKAGLTFRVELHEQHPEPVGDVEIPPFTRVWIMLVGDRYSRCNMLEDCIYGKPPNDKIQNESMLLLLEAFEPVAESTQAFLERLDAKHWMGEILDVLVKSGKITFADIENAYNEATKDVE